MDPLVYGVPAAGVVALIFAFVKSNSVSSADAGTDEMKVIAGRIADGARAFLVAEYKVLGIFVAVVAVLLGIANSGGAEQSPIIAVAFILGAVFSAVSGRHDTELYFDNLTKPRAHSP